MCSVEGIFAQGLMPLITNVHMPMLLITLLITVSSYDAYILFLLSHVCMKQLAFVGHISCWHIYGNSMVNKSCTYICSNCGVDTTGQRWVASLAYYNFKIFYKSGKLNVDADALSQIPWENTQVDHMEPLI